MTQEKGRSDVGTPGGPCLRCQPLAPTSCSLHVPNWSLLVGGGRRDGCSWSRASLNPTCEPPHAPAGTQPPSPGPRAPSACHLSCLLFHLCSNLCSTSPFSRNISEALPTPVVAVFSLSSVSTPSGSLASLAPAPRCSLAVFSPTCAPAGPFQMFSGTLHTHWKHTTWALRSGRTGARSRHLSGPLLLHL